MIRTIKRDAHDKTKGFRFQKLRAVQLMLTAMANKSESACIYCAIENFGDVRLNTSSDANSSEYIEEDKDYSEGTKFSLNSEEVLKSLVGFIDAWHKFGLSQSLYFGFCTTATIAKEKECKRTKQLSVKLPSEPLLEILSGSCPATPEQLEAIKKLILNEYKSQYSKHKFSGYTESLENWADTTWKEFFGRISWYFGEVDEKQLEVEVVNKLRTCSFYNEGLREKERHLISILIDEFDKKQNNADPAERFVHSSQIELVAKQVEAGEYRLSDPAWRMWKGLPPPEDTRNLIDKVHSTTDCFDEALLDSWCRLVALSRYEQDALKHDKSHLALRFRVFHCCFEKLLKISRKQHYLSQKDLEQLVDDLVSCTLSYMKSLAKDYRYPLRSEQALRGIILELADSCFLAFDTEKGV